MKIRLKIFFMFFLFVSISGFSVNVDSLIRRLPYEEDPVKKVDLYTSISSILRTSKIDSALMYAGLGVKLAKEVDYYSGIAENENIIGIVCYLKGDYDDAVKHFEAAVVELKKTEGNEKQSASLINNMAIIYSFRGDNDKALSYYLDAAKIYAEIDEQPSLARTYNNIGILYHGSKISLEKALTYFDESLKIKKNNNDQPGIASTLLNKGLVYLDKEEYEQARSFFDKSLMIRDSLQDEMNSGDCYSSIANVLHFQEKFEESIEFYKKAEKIYEKFEDQQGLGQLYGFLGASYSKLGNFEKAIFYGEKGLSFSKEMQIIEDELKAYLTLSEAYYEEGEYKKSVDIFKLGAQLKDSIFNKESSDKISLLEVEYQTEKKKKENEILTIKNQNQNLQIESQNNNMYRQRVIIVSSISGVVLLFGLSFYLMRSVQRKKKINIQIRKQKEEIESHRDEIAEKSKEITDSISYAKRIQSAILPPMKEIIMHLEDVFVLYKPKDIVAGDFYWLEYKDNKVLFAAADCTGHGVPGAMVSVICNNGLNRSVREYGLTDPGKILDKTREIVIQEFEKSEDEVKDGMDIAICSLEGNTLKYAGAHNPLWIIRNGEVLETKANKQPIGRFEKQTPYTTHTLELQKGDSVYIFSDGYVDQFGGEKGKKFKSRAFKKLLLNVQDHTMKTQKEIINDAFNHWRGNLEQIDDVCVIGVRI